MKPKDLAIVGLILVLVILLLIGRRRVSGYTQEEIDTIQDKLPIEGRQRQVVQKYLIKVIRNQLEKTDPLANVNALVDVFNIAITDPVKKLPPYGTITDFDNLITNVYTSGETSTMTERDRIILRAIAWPSMTILNLDTVLDPYTAPDGKADFTDTIVSETGKSIEELFKFAYVLLEMLMSDSTQGQGFSPESIDYVNSYIPSKYDPPFVRTDPMNILEALANKTVRAKFLAKLLAIGSIYIKWMIENKWKLDLTWRPSVCNPILDLPINTIMFLPSKTIKGPGTYTRAELGNPVEFIPNGGIKFEFKNDNFLVMSSGDVLTVWTIDNNCIAQNAQIIGPSRPSLTWTTVTITASSETSS
jgi:hypothetical protein